MLGSEIILMPEFLLFALFTEEDDRSYIETRMSVLLVNALHASWRLADTFFPFNN